MQTKHFVISRTKSPRQHINANQFKGGGSVVVDFLFIVTPIVGVCNCSMFCCMLLYVHSSIAIILMGKRELVALLNLSSLCLVMVERLFLTVPRGCLQFVIVVFPDHTHLLLFNKTKQIKYVILISFQSFYADKLEIQMKWLDREVRLRFDFN